MKKKKGKKKEKTSAVERMKAARLKGKKASPKEKTKKATERFKKVKAQLIKVLPRTAKKIVRLGRLARKAGKKDWEGTKTLTESLSHKVYGVCGLIEDLK